MLFPQSKYVYINFPPVEPFLLIDSTPMNILRMKRRGNSGMNAEFARQCWIQHLRSWSSNSTAIQSIARGFCQLIIHAGVDNSTHWVTQARGREALDSVSLIVKAFVEYSDRVSPCVTERPGDRPGEWGLLGYESVRLESGNIWLETNSRTQGSYLFGEVES